MKGRREAGNRRKVLDRVIGCGLLDTEADAEPCRSTQPDQVAVWWCLCDHADRDRSARTGTIFDHERLPQLLFNIRLHDARDCIGTAAGGKTNDETDRTFGTCSRRNHP